MYSLLGSAKLNGLDPEIYLHQVLERIADHPISRDQRPAALESRHVHTTGTLIAYVPTQRYVDT